MKVFEIGGGEFETEWVVAETAEQALQGVADMCGDDDYLKAECKELTEEETKNITLTDLDDRERPAGEKTIWQILQSHPNHKLPWHIGSTAF